MNLPVGMRVSHDSSASLEGGHELLEVAAGARRDVHARRPRDVAQVLLDLALEVAAAVVVEQVPLVVREHERAARLEHEVDDAHVLLARSAAVTSSTTTATSAFSSAAWVRSDA